MNGVKRLREAAGIKQWELANAVGVDRSTISKWEIGVQFPRTDKLTLIAKVLKCTVDQLLESA